MALYRCAACGSPNVVETTENSGYSYSKGLFGVALFGSGGAAVGINGISRTVYKCPNCGLTLDEPMSYLIKDIIDKYVFSSVLREENIPIDGLDWEYLSKKYPNIDPNGLYISSKRESHYSQYTEEEPDYNAYTYEDYIGLLDTEELLEVEEIDFLEDSRYKFPPEYQAKVALGFLKKWSKQSFSVTEIAEKLAGVDEKTGGFLRPFFAPVLLGKIVRELAEEGLVEYKFDRISKRHKYHYIYRF